MKTIVTILFLVGSSYAFGQQFVYTPKNPAFGGDPFNYTWLLNSANAQNPFTDESQFGDFGDLGALNNSLNNQLLGGQFGQGELPPLGTSQNGNLEYEVYESNEGLVINILDITTGEQTQIIVPN
ncbi:curli assembly protein CsgF [Constantimarinum furrinae]|uniref:Curli production assembly/transport component CsgF n=1 Tax=Constantimarinum furrinae TaxID=2562285 RepID=A0A7G8PR30_9FLAO|nr:curli assembly protein CsgF [Constantimarinum furrinae]QNJ96796.1 Type VIII secretion system (T8SS) CsgF [Constantimarinum furrinae]